MKSKKEKKERNDYKKSTEQIETDEREITINLSLEHRDSMEKKNI